MRYILIFTLMLCPAIGVAGGAAVEQGLQEVPSPKGDPVDYDPVSRAIAMNLRPQDLDREIDASLGRAESACPIVFDTLTTISGCWSPRNNPNS